MAKTHLPTVKSKYQSFILTGTVQDEKGTTLPGVTVINKNKNITVVANTNGRFGIEVDQGDSIIFRYVGFERKAIVAGANNIVVCR